MMKILRKAGIILLSILLCFQTVACSFDDQDVSTIVSVVSVIEELSSQISDTLSEEGTGISVPENYETVVSAGTSQQDETSSEPETEDKQDEKLEEASEEKTGQTQAVEYKFRNNKLLTEHYEKHGIEMGFKDKESYEKAASAVVNNPNALHKKEAEDNDDVYYIEETNEFVIVSTDGYLRTYFNPSSGIKYYNKQ